MYTCSSGRHKPQNLNWNPNTALLQPWCEKLVQTWTSTLSQKWHEKHSRLFSPLENHNLKLNDLHHKSLATPPTNRDHENKQSGWWWYTHPSEKSEFVNWDYYPQYIWENKIHVPNHQPAMIGGKSCLPNSSSVAYMFWNILSLV